MSAAFDKHAFVNRSVQRHGAANTINIANLTEDDIALAFIAAHGSELRFDHTRGAWFQWTGRAWRQDETRLAFSWARRVCRIVANGAKTNSKEASLKKAATASAVERFAQS
ncbi:MAG: hypothetical protein ACRYHQ_35850, partial [Janthinobacterium lividum]